MTNIQWSGPLWYDASAMIVNDITQLQIVRAADELTNTHPMLRHSSYTVYHSHYHFLSTLPIIPFTNRLIYALSIYSFCTLYSNVMCVKVHLTQEYRGLKPPPSVYLPTPAELISLCTKGGQRGYRMGFAYPPENPVLWIKSGSSVVWNEISAQVMAYYELQRLGSSVRVPSIYYACEMGVPGVLYDVDVNYESYIVMEYVTGKTAAQWLKSIEDTAGKERIYRLVGATLQALYHIPVPPGVRPAAIDGGRIRNVFFDDEQAPRHYQTINQLEQHLNLVRRIPTTDISLLYS
jgi:hypothetical protein